MKENVKIARIAIGLAIWAHFLREGSAFTPALTPASQVHLASRYDTHTSPRSLGQMSATPSRRRPHGERPKSGANGASASSSTQTSATTTWRLFNVDVALSEDEGKDSVGVGPALATAVAATISKCSTPVNSAPKPLEISVVRKSFDARLRRGRSRLAEPTFSYVIDVTFHGPIRLKYQRGLCEPSAEFITRNSQGNDAPENLNTNDTVDEEEEGVKEEIEDDDKEKDSPTKPRVVVVGSGPAGLFAALVLADAGYAPVVIERGQPVERRGRDIGALLVRRVLDPESNLCFGEGGAGTWSDGKLATQIGRNSDAVRAVLATLVEYGAPDRILVDSKPHLGTDRMVTILRTMRAGLQAKGVEFRFGTRVDQLVLGDDGGVGVGDNDSSRSSSSSHRNNDKDRNNGNGGGTRKRVTGVEVSYLQPTPTTTVKKTRSSTSDMKEAAKVDSTHDPGASSVSSSSPMATAVDSESGRIHEVVHADHVVLAVGHSARALYEQLASVGVPLQAKAFAVGFRIEHPQATINEMQYRQWATQTLDSQARRGYGKVPVADYKLTAQVDVTESLTANSDAGASSRSEHEGEELSQEVAEKGGQKKLETSSTTTAATTTSSDPRRAVYSFCMCPGGQIVPTSMDDQHVCVNGMSFSKRSSRWANSALVVSVHPSDAAIIAAGADASTDVDAGAATAGEGDGPTNSATALNSATAANHASAAHAALAGVSFQEAMEKKAAKMGGGNLVVPAQRVSDFMAGRDLPTGASLPTSSYRLGVQPARLDLLYPLEITLALRAALTMFEREKPGFASCPDALLHGVETRTSSPVTVPRHCGIGRDARSSAQEERLDTQATNDEATSNFPLECVGVSGVWPCGEGAGYAGGIVSAAVDGARSAAALLRALPPLQGPMQSSSSPVRPTKKPDSGLVADSSSSPGQIKPSSKRWNWAKLTVASKVPDSY